MNDLYTQDGVNVLEGDSFSKSAGRVCLSTFDNSPFVEVRDFSRGHFRGPRGFRLQNLPPDAWMDFAPDGIGSKTIIIDAARAHPWAAQDLFAMCCGDITRWGGLPLMLVNVLEVSTLGKSAAGATAQEHLINWVFRHMIQNAAQIAREQGIVFYKGETAEVGVCVGSENPKALTKFNWSGTAFGVYDSDRLITGDTVEAGQVVVALKENGFRSNGISSVRKALARKYGKDWYNKPEAAGSVKQAIEPSVLYDRFLATINGWHGRNRIVSHLITHVTGGAIRGKFWEDILVPRGLSAELDDLWEPPPIMRDCAEWRGMDDEEFYQTWNGGQGALVVLEESDVDAFIGCAQESRIQAKRCGRIVQASKRFVKIHSKLNGKEIEFTE